MQFEGRRRSSTVPNLTPLIDIVFLLLVFFMLTSHFVQERTVEVELPTAEGGEPKETVERVEVVLHRDGGVLIHDHLVEPEALVETLRQALRSAEEPVVHVRGDRASALGTTVRVLEAAREAGAEGVDIVTLEP